jgi:molybdate transport system regulatory protein
MAEADALRALLQLRKGSASRVGAERVALLKAIAEQGTIAAAAKQVGLSYKGAWDAVQALNNLFERPVVEAHPGGQSGGAAVVTPAGHALIAAFARLEAELSTVMGRLEQALAEPGADALNDLAWSLGMKTSARNALRGVVTKVTDGAVNCEVAVSVAPGIDIVAIITKDSVESLGLTVGAQAMALIKSSFVILAAGAEPVRTSARNTLSGIVIRHERGAVNDEFVLDIGAGKTVTATVTRESAEALGLAVGEPAQALIKASHVILAVD